MSYLYEVMIDESLLYCCRLPAGVDACSICIAPNYDNVRCERTTRTAARVSEVVLHWYGTALAAPPPPTPRERPRAASCDRCCKSSRHLFDSVPSPFRAPNRGVFVMITTDFTQVHQSAKTVPVQQRGYKQYSSNSEKTAVPVSAVYERLE